MGRWSGFGVTLRQMFGRRVTTQYPEEKRPKPPRFHGRHVLSRYEDGMEKCIGCELCAGVCPARCIYVRGADNPPGDPVSPGERYGFIYEINYLRCIHCDLCVEACPTEAITETKQFEFSFTNRQDAIYTKDDLLVDDAGRARRLPWEHWVGDEDETTSGWVRATAPSGRAEYEGVVAWSADLGFGLRSPERGQGSGGATGADSPPHGGAPTASSPAASSPTAGGAAAADPPPHGGAPSTPAASSPADSSPTAGGAAAADSPPHGGAPSTPAAPSPAAPADPPGEHA